MSREKQIEEMAKCCPYYDNGKCHPTDNETVDCDLMCNMFGFMANLENAGYRKQEWISVEERLPEDGEWVLGYSAKSGRGGLCNCLKSYVREFGNYDDTTHWLPLPEFPKKKGE